MAFPKNPTDGQKFKNYEYNSADGIWEFNPHYGMYDDMPAENARELVYNNTSIFEKDGYYWYKDRFSSSPLRIYSDMTTDWGGWMRIFSWDHDRDGISELQPYTEANDVQVYRQDKSQLYFSGGYGHNVFYSFPVLPSNFGEIKFIINIRHYSMEGSGFYFWGEANDSSVLDIMCKSSSAANNSPHFPKTCSDQSYNSSITENIDTTIIKKFSKQINSINMAWYMSDNASGDRVYIYDFEIWVR